VNVLPLAKQAAVIGALTEGVGVRAVSRLYGHHTKTINNLLLSVGEGCAKLHGSMMIGLGCQRLEIDEIHSFVGSKKSSDQKKGEQYTFIALCGASRAIVSYYTGKRTRKSAQLFLADARQRVMGTPEISSDCLPSYLHAIRELMGPAVYGRISKSFGKMYRADIIGRQEFISTQRVERQNLTLRQSQKRFGRGSSGYSKTFEHHLAAIALYVFNYNFCRIHRALRITPAMQLGVSNHIWSLEEMVSRAQQDVRHQKTVNVGAPRASLLLLAEG
jgi:IS1 family transposase